MKKIQSALICLMSVMLLAGCGGSGPSEIAEIDLMEKPDNVILISEEKDTEDDGGDEAEPVNNIKSDKNEDTTGEETEEAGNSETEFDFAGAFEEGQVYNNGSYFVRIGDKVYFRNIRPESMDEGAIFGNFLSTEFHAVNCPLISYDVNTCEWAEIGTVEGTEKLYACPGGFFIGVTDPDLFDASCTNFYDPVTKESSFFCKGLPLGVSESGRILAVEEYGGQTICTVLYKDGEEIVRLGGENIDYGYVGFAGETLIVMFENANGNRILCSVDEKGDITELGMIGNADNGYGKPEQFRFLNGCIYVSLGYYEGTGHFLSRWEIVKARPGDEGSLEIALNSDDVPGTYDGEGPDPVVPVFYFDTEGVLDISGHLPYEAYMGDGDKGNDLFYYNDVFEECLLVKDFINRSNYESCSIIQDMESITETAFVIYADAEADSEYDIGWRTGYRMTGWHICAIPFDSGHTDEEGMAENIIYFE
ncbi:MAG: hypothetical protein K5770_03120 [Lachnospiraceae bacterium]|nr:hypothetical protein [Lachnospiraceae bacterium]